MRMCQQQNEIVKSKPLFIPLKAEFFDAFERGEKTTEYRQRGPRGYGKAARLRGTIVGFSYDLIPAKLPGWLECYGAGGGDAACIKIQLEKP